MIAALSRRPALTALLLGIVAATGNAPDAVINHVAFAYGDHHRVIFGSEGPDQRVHIVLHPPRQVASDGLQNWSDGGVKVEVLVDVLEMAEDAG